MSIVFKTLILLENEHLADSCDLVAAAEKLSLGREAKVYGLSINLDDASEIKGFDYLIQVKQQALTFYDSRGVTDLVEQLQGKYQFDCILVLATSLGKMLAPRIAMRLRTGLVADITDIAVEKEEIHLIRPAFSGNAIASIVCETLPIMASVHANVFHNHQTTTIPEKINCSFQEKKASSIQLEQIIEPEANKDIRKSDVLVSFGGGFNGSVAQVGELATLLKGAVATSKKPVDAGIVSRTVQVGQSGKTVSPELYLALGISGSMQHIEGLKNVETIISVNNSKFAAMNYLADIVVIGDAVAFIEKLKKRMEEG